MQIQEAYGNLYSQVKETKKVHLLFYSCHHIHYPWKTNRELIKFLHMDERTQYLFKCSRNEKVTNYPSIASFQHPPQLTLP